MNGNGEDIKDIFNSPNEDDEYVVKSLKQKKSIIEYIPSQSPDKN
jgi:hypothetical protein